MFQTVPSDRSNYFLTCNILTLSAVNSSTALILGLSLVTHKGGFSEVILQQI